MQRHITLSLSERRATPNRFESGITIALRSLQERLESMFGQQVPDLGCD